jgi:hypothetical protein
MTHSATKLGKPPAPQFLSWLCVSLIWGSPLVMTTAPAFGLPAGQPVVPTAVSTDSAPNQPAVLPPPIAQKLIRQVSRETYIRPAQLKIAEIKPAGFDGCLGIYRPNQACTKILIQGYQAIVTGPNRTYVYHLSQDGTRIAQNPTASGARSPVRVSFESFGQPSRPGANVVFQSSISGDLTGRMSTVVLTQDGQITQYQSSPTARFRPVVLKTLSGTQLQAFQQVLQNRRFRNLDGLSYLTSAALADYPTTTYQNPVH